MNKVGLCSDHAGFELKEYIKQLLSQRGWEIKDFGTYSSDSCDYPDFAHPLALAVEAGEVYPGIAVCGTGNGICMTLNKHRDIRAALCWNPQDVSSQTKTPRRSSIPSSIRHSKADATSGASIRFLFRRNNF